MTSVWHRLVLGYIIVLPFVVSVVAGKLDALQPYTVALTMSSQVQGHVQLFYDGGAGFSEARSTTLVLDESGARHEYRLGLPPGRYRALRIDPGTLGARYTIERLAIVTTDGVVMAPIPLTALVLAPPATMVERSDDRLVIEAAPGPRDLQFSYVPATAIVIPRLLFNRPQLALLARIVALWMMGVGLLFVLERVTRRFAPRVRAVIDRCIAAATRRPAAALCIVGLLSTGIATYPVWLLGRSLVSPNNFGIPLLYDWVPFTPGATDVVIEDVRGSDVAATLLQGIPHSVVERRALASGEIPLWNRYNGGGRPLWGQALTFLGDPLHWLTLATPDPALGWDLKFLAHRFVFASGVGIAVLAATGAVGPALLAAAISPFGGLFLYRLNHPAIFVLTYAPWVLFAWFRLAAAVTRRERGIAALLLAASSSLVLVAGPPKEAAVMLAALESTGLLCLLVAAPSPRERRHDLVAAGVAGIAAVLITTPHWLVFFQTLAQSFTAYDEPAASFATRANAVGFFLGPLSAGPVQPGLHLVGLVLAIAAVLPPRLLLRNVAVTLCGGAAGVLLAIAFGAVPSSLLVRLPLVGNIVHIHDVFITAALPLLLVFVAAGGTMLSSAGSRVAYAVAAITGLVTLLLLAFVRTSARDNGFEPWAVALAMPLAIALPLCWSVVRIGVGYRVPAIAGTMLAGIILLLPSGLHARTGIVPVDQLLIQPRPRTALTGTSPAVDAVHRSAAAPARAVGLDMTLFSGSQALYDLEGIGGADPLDVARYRELIDASGIFRSMVWFTTVTPADIGRLAPLLDLLNVAFVLHPGTACAQ